MPIYGESIIGKDCFIDSDALIGYPHAKELEKESKEIAGCEIGNESIIRPGSVYSTAKLGKKTRTGHNFLVRENTTIGDGCLIGTNVVVDNNCKIGNLSPKEHKNIELKLGGQNYSPLEDVIVSHVKDSSTLICRKPSDDSIKKYVEEEVLDGLCCYSAVNQGQLNKTIVDAVVNHLTIEKLPTVPRSIRHKYMSAFLLATTQLTGMDRVVPKVAGVESWELTFKLCRRWGYQVKGIPENKAIIVGATGNFHGRSMTAISMSDDLESKENFGPFMQGI